jgi:hypothetical protein
MVKGKERVKKYYFSWIILFGIFSFFFFTSPYANVLIYILAFLLFKDIVIDILWKRHSVPEWFEHAPFVILISILGVFNLIGLSFFPNIITLEVTLIAIVDSIIDVADDFGLINASVF